MASRARQAATAAAKAGNTDDDMAKAVRAAAAEHSLDGNFTSLFIGHGVGIGANEPPYIGEDLAGAEVVEFLEDTIVVTNDGGRQMTRTAFDRRLLWA